MTPQELFDAVAQAREDYVAALAACGDLRRQLREAEAAVEAADGKVKRAETALLNASRTYERSLRG